MSSPGILNIDPEQKKNDDVVNGITESDIVENPSNKIEPSTNDIVLDNRLDAEDDKGNTNDNITTRRSHKSTPKGLQFKLKTFQTTLKTQSKRLQRQVDLLSQLILSNQIGNIDLVNNEVVSLEKIYSELCDTYARAVTVMTDDAIDVASEEYIAFATSMEDAEGKYFEIKTSVCQWQMQHEAKAESSAGSGRSSRFSSKHSSRSRSSSSHHSSASKKSNASDLSVRQRAKVQGLKAEAEAMVRTSEAELNAKLLRLQQKILKEEAKEKVYRETEHNMISRTRKINTITSKQITTRIN